MRRLPLKLSLLLVLLLGLATIALAEHAHEIPDNPKDICPLLIGNAVPAVNLQSLDGKTIRLSDEIHKKPSILIFYRGGW